MELPAEEVFDTLEFWKKVLEQELGPPFCPDPGGSFSSMRTATLRSSSASGQRTPASMFTPEYESGPPSVPSVRGRAGALAR